MRKPTTDDYMDTIINQHRKIMRLEHQLSEIYSASGLKYESDTYQPISIRSLNGKWIPLSDDELDVRMECSVCGSIETPLAKDKFCPNCGSRMTGIFGVET